MKRSLLAVSILFSCISLSANANTAVVVTADASNEGNAFVSYSVDSYENPSIEYVPAHDYTENDYKDIYEDGDTHKQILATIKQVKHTYAYLQANVGIINEKGLAIVYSENNSKLKYEKSCVANTRVFCTKELIKIALERCDNAKDALYLLTDCIEKYGFYSTPTTIILSDYANSYTLEIMPSVQGDTAYWVSKQVPTGQVYVTADQFRIQSINPDDDSLLFNQNLIANLQKENLAKFDSDDNLDWIRSTKAVEKRPYYSLRRVWRLLSLMQPSAKFKPYVKSYATHDYPFSIVPDKKVSIVDLMALHRDTYQGTKFDNSTKKTGGLFASPYTYEDYSERNINSTHCTYTFISVLGKDKNLPITFVSLGTPGEGAFTPLTVSEVPSVYTNVDRNNYDESKLWWITNNIASLEQGYYSSLNNIVKTAVRLHEQTSLTLISHSKALEPDSFKKVIKANAQTTYNRVAKLYAKIIEKHDGGYDLRYAEGHLPKFTPVDHYHQKAKAAPKAEKKAIEKKEKPKKVFPKVDPIKASIESKAQTSKTVNTNIVSSVVQSFSLPTVTFAKHVKHTK